MTVSAPAGPGVFDTIPLVDVSGLRSGDAAAAAEAAVTLGAAAREVGFAYITGHGIDIALFNRLLEVTTKFFQQPIEAKMQTWIGLSGNHRGYVPEGEEVFAGATPDQKEAFDLSLDLPADHPQVIAGARMLGPNQWPDLPDFKAAVSAWYSAVFDLGQVIFRGFALALGEPENLFLKHVSTPPSQLRLIHYPFDADAHDRPGIGAHTDYECFTLLRPTAPGLEVMNGAGEWIDAPLVPDAFVLNIGDMLELWTNGEFVATTHRVRKVAQERYSFPLFCNVDWDTEVAPLPQFVAPGETPRGAVYAEEHLWAQTVKTFQYLRDGDRGAGRAGQSAVQQQGAGVGQ